MTNYFKISEFFPNIEWIDQIKLQQDINYTNKLLNWWRIMNEIREINEYPIKITSTWRNKERNKKIGGSENSQHLTLDAIDYVPGQTMSLKDHINKDEIYRNMCRATIIVTNTRLLKIGQIIFYPYKRQIHIAFTNNKFKMRTLFIGHSDGVIERLIPDIERNKEFYKKIVIEYDTKE